MSHSDDKYFPPAESTDLWLVGVRADAAWLIVSEFVLGYGYQRQAPVLVPLSQVPPVHERFRNQRYCPAILRP